MHLRNTAAFLSRLKRSSIQTYAVPFNPDRHFAARDADLDAIAAERIHQRGLRTPEEIAEERAEARAAHGPGVELVNIFTGERPTT